MAINTARVLILTSTYPRWTRDTTPGFVADFAHNIAPALGSVYVLAPHYQGAASRETQQNIHVYRYRYFAPSTSEDIAYNGGGVSKIKKTPLYALKLACFLAAQFGWALYLTLTKRITIINAHWLIPQGFIGVLVKFLTRRKVVITIHGSDVLVLNGGLMKKIKAFTLRHADTVCVNSSMTLRACQALYNRSYQLIPMGIDIERFATAQASTALRKRYNLTDFTVLFVGRLSEEKGINYLLEALKRFAESGRTFSALIVGSGPLEASLKHAINEQGLDPYVTMVGWVDNSELPTYYKTADIMVGPSLHEAQGLVFLEALAAGLPVITTDAGGTKDFVKNGHNGFIVPVRSAEALYTALASLYDDRSLRKELTDHAAASVKNGYAWHTVAARYTAQFKELV